MSTFDLSIGKSLPLLYTEGDSLVDKSITFYQSDGSTAFDFSQNGGVATIEHTISETEEGTALITFSIANGKLTRSDNVITWVVPNPSDFSSLRVGRPYYHKIVATFTTNSVVKRLIRSSSFYVQR